MRRAYRWRASAIDKDCHFFNVLRLIIFRRGIVLRTATSIAPECFSKMNFTIQASKDGQTIETVRTGPTAAVAKARGLFKTGWIVQITSDRCADAPGA
jgi:hypothetical protein